MHTLGTIAFGLAVDDTINLIIILHTVLLTAIAGDLLVLPALLVMFAKPPASTSTPSGTL